MDELECDLQFFYVKQQVLVETEMKENIFTKSIKLLEASQEKGVIPIFELNIDGKDPKSFLQKNFSKAFESIFS